MSSVQAPSVATSVCPTAFDGTPSAVSTVKDLPSVCPIATLQMTAEDPVMTSSDSLDLRGHNEGNSEQAEAEEEPDRDSKSETPYWRHALNGAITTGVFVSVHEGHRLYFKHGNRRIRDEEERKDKEERESAAALSLAATEGKDAESEEDQ